MNTLSYNEKVFRMDSRLRQLADLRKLVTRLQFEEFDDVLNEIRQMLMHFKLNLLDEGNYTFVPFHSPVYAYERETTVDIVDQMIYIFLQTIVSEWNMASLYDSESAQMLMGMLDTSKRIGLSGYQRYLRITVSPVCFAKWNQKRKQHFVPLIETQFLKKAAYTAPVECGICLYDHEKKDMTACQCRHEFGGACFQGWMETCKRNGQDITCPNCREEVTKTTRFQQKGRPPRRRS